MGTLYMQIMHFCKKEIGNLSTSNNDTLTRSQSLNKNTRSKTVNRINRPDRITPSLHTRSRKQFANRYDYNIDHKSVFVIKVVLYFISKNGCKIKKSSDITLFDRNAFMKDGTLVPSED